LTDYDKSYFGFHDHGKQCVIDENEVFLNIQRSDSGEDYIRLNEVLYSYGEGFIFVYSITSRDSFDMIEYLYQNVLRAKGNVPICAVLVATKSDLQEERQVSTREGRELAERLHCQFIEASSETAVNVEESFYTLVREIRSNKEGQSKNDNPADKSDVSGCHCLVL
ncbi:Ras GTPase, partial [Entomortierella chlamydospora]